MVLHTQILHTYFAELLYIPRVQKVKRKIGALFYLYLLIFKEEMEQNM